MIKVISFDIGGTILEENKNNNYGLKELSSLTSKDYDLVKKVYKNIFQKTKGSFNKLVNAFCKELNITKNDELINFFKNKFSDDNKITEEARDLIIDLKKKGYIIILFSNNCCLCKSCLDRKIKKYIDKEYYSYNLGYTKNDDEAFKIIINELNVKPEEILHIGDNYTCDYVKPKENGLNALFYGNSDKEIDKISNLKEIYNYLGGNNGRKKVVRGRTKIFKKGN